jgi:hypothetical protein
MFFPVRALTSIVAAGGLALGAMAAPPGYVKSTIKLDAPVAGLAFAADGALYALENAGFGNNVATLRVVMPDGSLGGSFPVIGDDPSNFFVGSMAYDAVTDRLLVSDNTADGRLYAVDRSGNQQTIAVDIAGIAGIAVRTSGEIFVSTAPFGSAGDVRQVDRATGASTPVLGELGFGGGLAFDAAGHLLVQDADSTTLAGRVQRLPVSQSPAGLVFGVAEPVASGMASSAGLAVDSDGDVFSTGSGGLYLVGGAPPAESLFDSNGAVGQFATAIAFYADSAPFERFAGAQGGRLAYMADFGFGHEDDFVTLLMPAASEDFNSDGAVDAGDLAVWATHFGTTSAAREQGDADSDGDIDGNDFMHWQRAATGTGPAATSLPGVATPEPAAWILNLTACAPFAWQICRNRYCEHWWRQGG